MSKSDPSRPTKAIVLEYERPDLRRTWFDRAMWRLGALVRIVGGPRRIAMAAGLACAFAGLGVCMGSVASCPPYHAETGVTLLALGGILVGYAVRRRQTKA